MRKSFCRRAVEAAVIADCEGRGEVGLRREKEGEEDAVGCCNGGDGEEPRLMAARRGGVMVLLRCVATREEERGWCCCSRCCCCCLVGRGEAELEAVEEEEATGRRFSRGDMVFV
jgi:hypothetical protein